MSLHLFLFFAFALLRLVKPQSCDSSVTNCVGCSISSTICDICMPGFYNLGGNCTNSCPSLSVGTIIGGEGICLCDGKAFMDDVQNICIACDPSCTTCYGPSASECGLDGNFL